MFSVDIIIKRGEGEEEEGDNTPGCDCWLLSKYRSGLVLGWSELGSKYSTGYFEPPGHTRPDLTESKMQGKEKTREGHY